MRTNSALRQRRIGARPGRVVGHVVRDAGRPAREQQNTVGEIDRLLEIVRDQHRGGAGLDEDALELVAHEQRHLVVERRERLVEKQDFRLDHERAHDRDQLLLAARQLIGIALEVDLDAEMGDQPLGARAPLGLRQLHQLERILDVVDRAQPRKQRLAIILEHVAELDVAQRLAVEQDFAGIGRDEPGDHVDQRALAAAVRAEHRDELAARDIEVEAVVDHSVDEVLGQAADGDVGGCRRRAAASPRHAARIRAQTAFSRPTEDLRSERLQILVTSTFS